MKKNYWFASFCVSFFICPYIEELLRKQFHWKLCFRRGTISLQCSCCIACFGALSSLSIQFLQWVIQQYTLSLNHFSIRNITKTCDIAICYYTNEEWRCWHIVNQLILTMPLLWTSFTAFHVKVPKIQHTLKYFFQQNFLNTLT